MNILCIVNCASGYMDYRLGQKDGKTFVEEWYDREKPNGDGEMVKGKTKEFRPFWRHGIGLVELSVSSQPTI